MIARLTQAGFVGNALPIHDVVTARCTIFAAFVIGLAASVSLDIQSVNAASDEAEEGGESR